MGLGELKNGWNNSQTKQWGLRAPGAWRFIKNCYESGIDATKEGWKSLGVRWADTKAAFKERPALTTLLTLLTPLRWVVSLAGFTARAVKETVFIVVETGCYAVEGGMAVITDAADALNYGAHKAAAKLTSDKPAAVAA